MELLNQSKTKIGYDIVYCEKSEYDDNKLEKNICNLKYINSEQQLFLYINFELIKESDYKRIIKKLKKLINNFVKKNYGLFSTIIYVYAYNNENSKHADFINAIHAIMKLNKKEMYNYIYDTVYDYLDCFFAKNNVCDFHNDKCGLATSSNVGCCRHFKYPMLFNNKLVVCEHLKDKKCSVRCISCKLFTCEYLRKKGIVFKQKEIFLLDTFFNPVQKFFIKCKVFTTKEQIIKLLLFWSF